MKMWELSKAFPVLVGGWKLPGDDDATLVLLAKVMPVDVSVVQEAIEEFLSRLEPVTSGERLTNLGHPERAFRAPNGWSCIIRVDGVADWCEPWVTERVIRGVQGALTAALPEKDPLNPDLPLAVEEDSPSSTAQLSGEGGGLATLPPSPAPEKKSRRGRKSRRNGGGS